MKEGAVVLLVVLALGGGIVWWSMRDQVAQPAQPATLVAAAPTKSAKPPAVSKKRKSSAAEMSSTGQKSVEPPPPVAEASATIPVELLLKPQPFPSVDQIDSGAQEEQIISKYGEPALSITTSDHDHVFETFVYSHERGELQTLIRIQDGKVLAAYSQSIPAAFDAPTSPRTRH